MGMGWYYLKIIGALKTPEKGWSVFYNPEFSRQQVLTDTHDSPCI
jgi:hypothetical protein